MTLQASTKKMTRLLHVHSKKYFYKYFNQLGYSYFYAQDILIIPKTITFKKQVEYENALFYNNLKQQIFNKNHTFTKKELCLILEKYFYCNRILNIAPLTKYLHLNFKFIKYKNTNFYKIQVNYIFATPTLTNCTFMLKLKLQLYFSELTSEKSLSGYKIRNGIHMIKQLILNSTVIHSKKLTPMTLNKFLHIFKNTKFQATYHFYNLMKSPNSDTKSYNPIEVISYSDSIAVPQSIFTGDGCTYDINMILKAYPYAEPTAVNIEFHCALPFKILALNLFKYFKITNDLDFFYFLFYNYCLIKNIYFSENKKIIQILQNNNCTQEVIKTLKHFSNAKDYEIYDSLLINNVEIQEIELGDTSWFIENINTIAETMSNILDVYLTKEEILSKLHKILEKNKLTALMQLLKISKFLTKQELLIEKEYDSSETYLNWYTIMILYILKFKNVYCPDEIQYVQGRFEDLDELLLYTNIFENKTSSYADSRKLTDDL